MCGLAGIVLKQPGDVGQALVAMGTALVHRGGDSTGFAIYDEVSADHLTVSLHAVGVDTAATRVEVDAVLAAAGIRGELMESLDRDAEFFARYRVSVDADPATLTRYLESVPGVTVHAVGRALTVIKDLGSAAQVDQVHRVGGRRGRHGTVHCRLATQGTVDVDASHPFWARPFPDVSVVHHGHITNSERLRRLLCARGFTFRTDNDSETLAVYLADRLDQGEDLEVAMAASLRDLDGIFTYLLATADGVGVARDRWGACPLVVAETDTMIAFGSEEYALLTVVPEGTRVRSIGEEAVLVWKSTVTS